jgi:hypothetical protein
MGMCYSLIQGQGTAALSMELYYRLFKKKTQVFIPEDNEGKKVVYFHLRQRYN